MDMSLETARPPPLPFYNTMRMDFPYGHGVGNPAAVTFQARMPY